MPPRSPDPLSIFRWEDSSALEHSCWSCSTKSNSPKALQTCYGIHSIPCIAYHSTMHAIGTSHRCSGCINNREIHDGRHKEIAELVAQYHEKKFELQNPPSRKYALDERSANTPQLNVVRTEELDEVNEVLNGDEYDGVSDHDRGSVTTSNDHISVVKLTKSEQRELKKTLKAQKSVKKAAKHEARHAIQITAAEISRVGRIIHGDNMEERTAQSQPLATDKTIEDVIARNLSFVKQIECHKEALYETIKDGRRREQERKRARKRVSGGCEDVESEGVVDAIMAELGIDCVHNSGSKRAKAGVKHTNTSCKPNQKAGSTEEGKLVSKLRELIRDDLEKHENDLRQTYIRAGGFFRYAGKAVFERMTDIARRIDLQTGEEWEKKREREAKIKADERGREDTGEDL